MIRIVCMAGLGDWSKLCFGALKQALNILGHRVVLIDVEGIKTHQDRIDRVVKAFEDERRLKHQSVTGGHDKIFLLGQSAGAGAVREAEFLLRGEPDLTGIILMSQSMPKFFLYMTWTLLWVMVWRLWDLVLGRTIKSTEKEYTSIVSPMPYEQQTKYVAHRQPLPGHETRELAFYPPELKPMHVPTLVIYGRKDRWISVNAHRKLCAEMKRMSPGKVTCHEIEGAGHHTLASDMRDDVIGIIVKFIMETK